MWKKKKKKYNKKRITFPEARKIVHLYNMTNQIRGHMQLLYFILQKGYGNTSLLKGIILTGLCER